MMEFGASIVLTVLLFGVSSFPYDDVMIIYLRDDDYVTVLADKMLSFQVFFEVLLLFRRSSLVIQFVFCLTATRTCARFSLIRFPCCGMRPRNSCWCQRWH